jgi:hypothetical protein
MPKNWQYIKKILIINLYFDQLVNQSFCLIVRIFDIIFLRFFIILQGYSYVVL